MTPALALLAAYYAPDAAALGDDRYAARERAEARLHAAGWAAYPALRAAGRSPDCEVRHRAARLRGRLEAPVACWAVLVELASLPVSPWWDGDPGEARDWVEWSNAHDPAWHVIAVGLARAHGLAPPRDFADCRPTWEVAPFYDSDFAADNVLRYWRGAREWREARPKKEKR